MLSNLISFNLCNNFFFNLYETFILLGYSLKNLSLTDTLYNYSSFLLFFSEICFCALISTVNTFNKF